MKNRILCFCLCFLLSMFPIRVYAEMIPEASENSNSENKDELSASEIYTMLMEYYQETEPGVIKDIEVMDNGDNSYMANVYCGVPNNPDGRLQRLYELYIDPDTGQVTGTNVIVSIPIESFSIPYGIEDMPEEDVSAVPDINQTDENGTEGISEASISDWLEADQTYQDIDLNGDGTEDSICLHNADLEYSEQAFFTINEEEAFVFPGNSAYAGFRIISLETGKKAVFVNMEESDYPMSGFLLYPEGNKLIQAADFSELLKEYQGGGYLPYNDSVTVNGNTITINYESMSWTFGPVGYEFEAVYKGNKLIVKRRGNVWKNDYENPENGVIFSPVYTAAQELNIYSDPEDQETVYTVLPGESISIKRFRLYKGELWFRAKCQTGADGWFCGLTRGDVAGSMMLESPLFENTHYAG